MFKATRDLQVMLVAVPIRTLDGLRHVTGQTIDPAGLLAVHPELSETGFTGRWQITNVITGHSMNTPESAAWMMRLELGRGGGS
jgi:hypothetical protein